MQIGDLHESVTRDATARREAMVGQIRQMVERLNVAPPGAIPPAAAQADTVRISPEARQAMNSLAGAAHGSGGASPGQVIAAIRAVLVAGTPESAALAAARLGELVRNIVATFPARSSGPLQGYPIDDRAADLVRALLPAAGQSSPPPATVAAMVRALFVGQAENDAPPEATPQRAALAIFLAATRVAAEGAPPGTSPAFAETQARTGDLPAALLGHLVPPEKRARSERVSRTARRQRDTEADDGESGQDDAPPDHGDRRDPQRGA